jgi:peptide/nickel transport system substrate-binding protein
MAVTFKGTPVTASSLSTCGIASLSTPTGLLPTLASAGYVDKSVESSLGATYDQAKAKQLLASSGYNGRTLTLEASQGWSDWNTAQQVIAQELNAVGIKVQVTEPSFNQRTADITNGTYDLALDNNAGLDSTRSPTSSAFTSSRFRREQSSQQNWARINSPADWALVQKAAATAPSDTATLNQIYSSLEKDFLTQQPEIPLWYNGVWFQGNTQYWQGFPSSDGSA